MTHTRIIAITPTTRVAHYGCGEAWMTRIVPPHRFEVSACVHEVERPPVLPRLKPPVAHEVRRTPAPRSWSPTGPLAMLAEAVVRRLV